MPRGRVLLEGQARAPTLRLEEPLSFWGALDPHSGRIVDRHHPQLGAIVTDVVLVMPRTRGSTSSSGTLAEAVRAGTGPAAVILGEPDVAVVTGLVAARELYGSVVPVILLEPEALRSLPNGEEVEIGVRGDVMRR